MIQYQSTRGSKETKTSAQAIIQGIGEDKGLYVPSEIPALPFTFEEMVGKPYKDVAFRVMKAFFEDYTEEELQACIDSAYDSKFEEEEIVPVKFSKYTVQPGIKSSRHRPVFFTCTFTSSPLTRQSATKRLGRCKNSAFIICVYFIVYIYHHRMC